MLDVDESLEALSQASAAVAGAQVRLEAAVRQARAAGATWAQVGEMVGVSRQAAHERWGHIPRAGCPREGCGCSAHDVVPPGCECGHGPGRGRRVITRAG